MARRPAGEVNAGSMADIAFLLLIFFLVTTTMDVDSGLTRKLPPPPDENQPEEDNPIKERNVFIVLVNSNNDLLVEGELMDIADLRENAKEFIANPGNDADLPEKEAEQIDHFGVQDRGIPGLQIASDGKVMRSKQVISLQNDLGTRYGTYIAVQNELVAAYNELREELAQAKWGKPYSKLDEEFKDAINDVYPQRISEAEPKKVN